MRTANHQNHLSSRVAHNNCDECRADCERQFLRPQWTRYQHVTEYLAYVRPRLKVAREAIPTSMDARFWHRDFLLALQRRITLKGQGESGRKQNDSYRQRLNQFSRNPNDNHYADAAYLRRYAMRGASTL